jgi:tetratricopeptide (TPR) repeat protein
MLDDRARNALAAHLQPHVASLVAGGQVTLLRHALTPLPDVSLVTALNAARSVLVQEPHLYLPFIHAEHIVPDQVRADWRTLDAHLKNNGSVRIEAPVARLRQKANYDPIRIAAMHCYKQSLVAYASQSPLPQLLQDALIAIREGVFEMTPLISHDPHADQLEACGGIVAAPWMIRSGSWSSLWPSTGAPVPLLQLGEISASVIELVHLLLLPPPTVATVAVEPTSAPSQTDPTKVPSAASSSTYSNGLATLAAVAAPSTEPQAATVSLSSTTTTPPALNAAAAAAAASAASQAAAARAAIMGGASTASTTGRRRKNPNNNGTSSRSRKGNNNEASMTSSTREGPVSFVAAVTTASQEASQVVSTLTNSIQQLMTLQAELNKQIKRTRQDNGDDNPTNGERQAMQLSSYNKRHRSSVSSTHNDMTGVAAVATTSMSPPTSTSHNDARNMVAYPGSAPLSVVSLSSSFSASSISETKLPSLMEPFPPSTPPLCHIDDINTFALPLEMVGTSQPSSPSLLPPLPTMVSSSQVASSSSSSLLPSSMLSSSSSLDIAMMSSISSSSSSAPISSLPACFTSEDVPARIISAAIQRCRDIALTSLETTLSMSPHNPAANLDKGLILHAQGMYKEALPCYEMAVAGDPSNADAWSHRGLTLENLGRYPEAVESYTRSIDLRRFDASTLHNRAVTLAVLKHNDRALADYDASLLLRPGYAPTLTNRGDVLLSMGRTDDAIDSYQRSLVSRAEHVPTLMSLGQACRAVNKHSMALQTFEHVLRLQPLHEDAAYYRARELEELDRKSHAAEAYAVLASRDTCSVPTKVKALFQRANLLDDMDQPEMALMAYDCVLKFSADHIDSLYNRALTLRKLGRTSEARIAFQMVLHQRCDDDTLNQGALEQLNSLDRE